MDVFTHVRSSCVSPITAMLVFALTTPCWYVHMAATTDAHGPKTVAGSALGANELRGAGSRTTMTLVPNGIVGRSSTPASARKS